MAIFGEWSVTSSNKIVTVKTQIGDKRRIFTLERYDEKPPLMASHRWRVGVCV